jgi:hypothetical protein
MTVEMQLSKVECAAMIALNIAQTWPAPPNHKWTAEWSTYASAVTLRCEPVETVPEVTKEEVKA